MLSSLRQAFITSLPLRVLPLHRYKYQRTLTMIHKAASTAPSSSTITVIGAGGNIATSLITGLLSHQTPPTIHAANISKVAMAHLPLPESHKHTDNLSAITGANLVILALKPPLIPVVLTQLAPSLKQNPTPVLSVAAGITTTVMEKLLISEIGTATPILRAMPNTPAAHSAGVTALCKGATATEEHLEMAKETLSAVGDVIEIPESLFTAATSLAGSGVAYVFMMAEAIADAGVQCGLPRDTAIRMAAGTIQGAGVELQEAWKEGVHPAVLRNRVESPGGGTIRATAQLERMGFRAGLIDAIVTASERYKEIGQE